MFHCKKVLCLNRNIFKMYLEHLGIQLCSMLLRYHCLLDTNRILCLPLLRPIWQETRYCTAGFLGWMWHNQNHQEKFLKNIFLALEKYIKSHYKNMKHIYFLSTRELKDKVGRGRGGGCSEMKPFKMLAIITGIATVYYIIVFYITYVRRFKFYHFELRG